MMVIALLQRQTGTLLARDKPADAAPDFFDPIAGELVFSNAHEIAIRRSDPAG